MLRKLSHRPFVQRPHHCKSIRYSPMNAQGVLPNVRLVRLSRHYGLEVALAAALDHCIGDYVVVMDPTTDPPELVPSLVARAIAGCDDAVGDELASKDANARRTTSAFQKFEKTT